MSLYIATRKTNTMSQFIATLKNNILSLFTVIRKKITMSPSIVLSITMLLFIVIHTYTHFCHYLLILSKKLPYCILYLHNLLDLTIQ